MPMPLSEEMRKKIIVHKENGETEAEIVKWLQISQSAITRIWRKYREENTIAPKPHNKGRKPAFGEDIMKQITAKIAEQPDITLEELVEYFGLKISISALSRKLTKLDLTFKKRRCFARNSFVPMCNGYAESG
jgi:putative transposase